MRCAVEQFEEIVVKTTRSIMKRRPFAIVTIAMISACGGSGDTPTAAVPTPAPTAAPTPSVNPYAAACGTPLPSFADSYGFGIKVQLEPSLGKKVLSANPIVRNAQYCAAAGSAGSTICNTRREDDPQRVPCDHYLAGISDEGRPGPNWFEDIDNQGTLVKCGKPEAHCEVNATNQYLLDVYAPGAYVACGGKGSPGTCGVCVLAPSTFGVIHRNPSGLCGLS